MTEIGAMAAAWVLTMSAVWAALLRHGKGLSPGFGFGAGLILGPLGVVLCALQGGSRKASAAVQCPECEKLNAARNRFCDDCGKPLHYASPGSR